MTEQGKSPIDRLTNEYERRVFLSRDLYREVLSYIRNYPSNPIEGTVNPGGAVLRHSKDWHIVFDLTEVKQEPSIEKQTFCGPITVKLFWIGDDLQGIDMENTWLSLCTLTEGESELLSDDEFDTKLKQILTYKPDGTEMTTDELEPLSKHLNKMLIVYDY